MSSVVQADDETRLGIQLPGIVWNLINLYILCAKWAPTDMLCGLSIYSLRTWAPNPTPKPRIYLST